MNGDMGKVVTRIKLQNWADIEMLAAGQRSQPPRTVETDALVDTGAVKLYLKSAVIGQLGLRPIGEVTSQTMSNRYERRRVFSPVDLEIQGRSGRFDVVEIPDALPNIIGQIPLEDLDWVVDPHGQKLIGNPEHKGEQLYDEF